MSATANIIQALISKHWRLCWRSLLIQQASVLAVGSLLISTMATDPNMDGHSITAQAVVLVSLIFLLTPVLSESTKRGKVQGTGFPYLQEYSLPVPTTLLVLVPLLFYVALMLFAYLVPITILSAIFDVSGAQTTFAIILIESILVVLSLSWWSSNSMAHGLSWALVILLYWNQILYPDFTVVRETAVAEVSGASVYIESAIATLVLVAIMIAGVKRQRYGENLLGMKKDNIFQWTNLSARSYFPKYQEGCPTNSSIAAENWRERQLRGLQQAVPLGLMVGLTCLIAINLISGNGGMEDGPVLEDVAALSGSFYLLIIMILQMQVFGISYRSGQLFNTAFDRCRPMSTSRLLYIKLTNNIVSLLAAAVTMLLVYWLFGSLLIENFAEIKLEAISFLGEFFSTPLLVLLRNTFLFSIMACTLLFLYGAMMAWAMLRPKLLGWIVSGVAIYAFLLIVLLIQLTEYSEFSELNTYVRNKHLWILVLGLPAALIYLGKSLLEDHVLNRSQLANMVIASVVVLLIYIIDQSATGFYQEANALEVTL
ncbi:MAG: hypothetical protein HOF74_10170 [Gammaproteobacteria bacterium]|jgi:hypothetical protein|nr:hypothetical protein [Gammaproteobacteria bacterium]MBT3860185.1 hypothetical protein [Gammaproteobacteria bacterium]MBT3987477.1 hypothetical protein [Gammaproteobacteria bacterium]MBT4257493.1 hypothetical protein [Gammaproteobacteria bacterium]MBT4581785.1 hypothetical protein [Gammaproteobacteria bacterium]